MAKQGATLEIEDNVLTISGNLHWSDTARFDEKCQHLAGSGVVSPTVDLAGVGILTSPFLGILSQIAIQCLDRNTPLIIRVPAKLLSLFHTLNFEKFSKIEVI